MVDDSTGPARGIIELQTALPTPNPTRIVFMIFKKRPKASPVHAMSQLEELAATGRPILVDFYQFGCAPCQVMDGIVDEIADEFGDGAVVVKINVANAPWAVEAFKIRSTPTFVVLAQPRQEGAKPGKFNQRWRQSGLVKKDALRDVLVQAGAQLPDSV